jgi:RHS repeat-associated protein
MLQLRPVQQQDQRNQAARWLDDLLVTSARTRRLLGVTAAIVVGATATAAFGQTSASPYTSGVRYDLMHRITGTIAPDPDGAGPIHYAAVRNTYDTRGRLVTVEKGELSVWQSEQIAPAAWGTNFTVFSRVDTSYDSLDRKVMDKISGGGTVDQVTQYSYDGMGRLQCTAVRMNPAAFGSLPTSACTLGPQGAGANAFGPDRITRNNYDPAGDLLSVEKAYATPLVQKYASYTYDWDGKPISVTDANGNIAKMRYDGFEREISWSFPSKSTAGSTATCTDTPISENGNVVGPPETRAASDDCEKYAYDKNGNRVTLMKRDGQIIRYSYDNLNRVKLKDDPGTANDVYYGYDLWGHQLYARFGSSSGVGITDTYDGFGRHLSSSTNMDGIARVLSYQWDADGNRKRLTYPDGNYFVYLYDGLDRLTAIQENGGGQIASFSFDNHGDRVGETRGAVATSYGYDGVSRLTSLGHDIAGTADDVTWIMGYSPANQIASITRSNDLYAYPYAATNKSYFVNHLNQYSSAGGVTLAYDNNGNLTSDGTYIYSYDPENRLITASNGTTLSYDPEGRLWQVVSGSGTTRFLYDGDAIIEELNAGGTLLRRYVHGSDDDDPIIWYEGSGLSDRRSFQADHQGSIVSIADSSGSMIDLNTYDEYGIPGSTNVGRFQYTGQVYLSELGIYYYKARFYSSRLGRFLQIDPVGYKDQVNLYAYVANDPVDGTDPTGMSCNKNGTLCTADTPTTSTTTIRNGPAEDKAMHDNAGQVRVTSSATSEKIGFIHKDAAGNETFRSPSDARTGGNSNQDNARASSEPGDVAVLHSHIPGRDEGMQDDASHHSLGDTQPLTKGLTNGTVMGDRLGVHEQVDGKLQFRMIDGKMTHQERRDMQRNLNEEQKLFQ